MRTLIEDFKDSAFIYEGNRFQVTKAKIINGIAVLVTDHKTFSLTESEFELFYDAVSFVKASGEAVVVHESKSLVLNAEIIQSNTISARLTSKLESIFDEVSKPGANDKTFRQAEAMVKASNAIVNVQMANYKYLTLK